MKSIIYNLAKSPVLEIDSNLHSYILNKVHTELSNLVEDCYYPKISTIFKELLHVTKTDEKRLIQYSKEKYEQYKKYPELKWYLLHDPFTTLLISITQEFLKKKDMAAAIATYNLFTLRVYSNLLHKYLKFCNPDYFRTAVNNLSHNHIYSVKKNIPNAILYLSSVVFQRFQKDIETNNAPRIIDMIYELRHRVNQSVKSFAHHYHDIAANKTQIKTSDELDSSTEMNIKQHVDRIAKDIALYKKVSPTALQNSIMITKFNKVLAQKYVHELTDHNNLEDLNLLLYLLLKDFKDLNKIHSDEFLKYIKFLMSVKVSKKEVYFKKILSKIHDNIIKKLDLQEWFNNVSVQTQFTSKSFLSYYIALFSREYM